MITIQDNYEIKKETTFKIGGIVKKVAFPQTTDELIELINTNEYDLVLGGCSNVLFSSQYVNKNIILTKEIKDYTISGRTVYVSCGTRGPLISKECKERGLTGFEFLIGFPGSFGGMVYMNSSAHNQAIMDNFVKATVYDQKNKKIITLTKSEMQFKYRHSILSQNNLILLNAKFELQEGNKDQIDEIMNRNIEFRKLRQPSLTLGNAGSIFKNPENDSAGRLLDLCEMKGQKEGGAMIFEGHANFIVNYNNATSTDVIKLMQKMHTKVKEKYRIELVPEIKYIGDEGTEEDKLWKTIINENIQTTLK